MEEWSDGVAYDGTACVVQPLIAPLYGGKSLHEVIAALTPAGPDADSYDTRSGHEIVRAHWKTNQPGDGDEPFERFWQRALHDGVIRGTRPALVTPALADFADRPEMRPAAPAKDADGLELVIAPDYATHDGRFANNGWLQEWPRPLTKLSWDNAVILGPETAKKLGVGMRIDQWKGGEHGDTIADTVLVSRGQWRLEAVPVWVQPGHAEGAVTVHLGYGRERAGRVGTQVGFNAYKMRLSTAGWILTGVRVSKTTRTHQLACQQAHHGMEGRDIVRSGTAAEYKADPKFAQRHGHGTPAPSGGEAKKHSLPTLYDGKDHPYDGYKWGMAIDLTTCTGCSACVVACQAENNIPVVGKDQVLRAREMHWLRIDRYFETPSANPQGGPLRTHFQPVPCMHCENAPCEYVCPTEATVHSDEGLNDMVYNRCVGTRYCQQLPLQGAAI
ncbi:MAG: 4Fe-4S dicluster domain-containing protein [Gemmataceae bacterium]